MNKILNDIKNENGCFLTESISSYFILKKLETEVDNEYRETNFKNIKYSVGDYLFNDVNFKVEIIEIGKESVKLEEVNNLFNFILNLNNKTLISSIDRIKKLLEKCSNSIFSYRGDFAEVLYFKNNPNSLKNVFNSLFDFFFKDHRIEIKSFSPNKKSITILATQLQKTSFNKIIAIELNEYGKVLHISELIQTIRNWENNAWLDSIYKKWLNKFKNIKFSIEYVECKVKPINLSMILKNKKISRVEIVLNL